MGILHIFILLVQMGLLIIGLKTTEYSQKLIVGIIFVTLFSLILSVVLLNYIVMVSSMIILGLYLFRYLEGE